MTSRAGAGSSPTAARAAPAPVPRSTNTPSARTESRNPAGCVRNDEKNSHATAIAAETAGGKMPDPTPASLIPHARRRRPPTESRPPPRDGHRDHRRGNDDDGRFLGGVRQPRAGTGRDGCARRRALRVTPHRDQERDREKREDRFLDVETAVVGQRRREGRQRHRDRDGHAAEAARQGQEEEQQPGAEERRHGPDGPRVERRERRLSARPRRPGASGSRGSARGDRWGRTGSRRSRAARRTSRPGWPRHGASAAGPGRRTANPAPAPARRQPGRRSGLSSLQRRAVDLDFDVVVQVVRRVAVRVEPHVAAPDPFGSNSRPSATSMYSLSFPMPSPDELS